MDLVAHHVDLDVYALLGEEGGQSRHLEGVPQRGELPRVDQAQRGRRAGARRCLDLGRGDDGAPQLASPAGAGDARLDERPQLLRLAEHPSTGAGNGGQARALLVVDVEGALGDIREIGPQSPVQLPRRCRRGDEPQAAHHDQVGRLLGVEALDERYGGIGAERCASRCHSGHERIDDGDAGEGAQRVDEASRLDRCLEHHPNLDAGAREGLAHRLYPDSGAVEDVEVDIPVDDRAQRAAHEALTSRASVGCERAGWPRRCPARRSSRS